MHETDDSKLSVVEQTLRPKSPASISHEPSAKPAEDTNTEIIDT